VAVLMDLDELVDHWTLLKDERELVAGKRGPTRLGFALLLTRCAARTCGWGSATTVTAGPLMAPLVVAWDGFDGLLARVLRGEPPLPAGWAELAQVLSSYRAWKAGDRQHARAVAQVRRGCRRGRWSAGTTTSNATAPPAPWHRQGSEPRHGRAAQTPVLGLCAFTHDSATALVVDGRLVGVVEEERLSGVKHTKAYPAQAVRWLLDHAGLGPGDVGLVAYNFAGHRYLAAIPGSLPYLLRRETRVRVLPRAASFAVVHARYRRRMRALRVTFPSARVDGVAHHRAHGLYAAAASGYADAAVPIVDSLGETQTTTIGRAHIGERAPATGSWRRSATRTRSAMPTARSPSTWAGAAVTRKARSWRWRRSVTPAPPWAPRQPPTWTTPARSPRGPRAAATSAPLTPTTPRRPGRGPA